MNKTFCDYYNQSICRSCSELDVPYAEQMSLKEQRLRDALSAWGELPLLPTQSSPETAFRNRAKWSVSGSTSRPIIGLLGEDRLDQGREILNCPIHHPKLNELANALPKYIQKFNLIPYQISERLGELKGLIAYHSPESCELYLRFILRSQECVSRIRKLLRELQAEFPGLVCVSANIQPIPHALLEGDKEIFLTERKSIRHRLGDIELNLAPQAFVQTNAQVSRALYETAARFIAEIRPFRMLELFSGQGAFSFFAAASADRILGIEINADAVLSANETAQALGLKHLSFQSADAGQVQKLAEHFSPDLILVNPPRRGIGQAVQIIHSIKPRYWIYSSCSYLSLVQDLETFKSTYRLKHVQIFDLFPHTQHFEILVLLELKTNHLG
ncbi:MAG: methyltransferase domain-containing protein [Proteobacteria bacterium]|nr:MAG: methyltransferase domain-containing protein [Pseudomonadota bacterium]